MSNIFPSFILFLWLMSSLYVGFGGYLAIDLKNMQEYYKKAKSDPVTYRGVTFDNPEQRDCAIEDEKFEKFYWWAGMVPYQAFIMLTSGCFGMLGGIIRIFKEIVVDGITIQEAKYFSVPIFCFLIGIVIIGVSHLIPAVLVVEKTNLKAVSIIFLSLFAGIFSDHFYKWISFKFDSIFKQ